MTESPPDYFGAPDSDGYWCFERQSLERLLVRLPDEHAHIVRQAMYSADAKALRLYQTSAGQPADQ